MFACDGSSGAGSEARGEGNERGYFVRTTSKPLGSPEGWWDIKVRSRRTCTLRDESRIRHDAFEYALYASSPLRRGEVLECTASYCLACDLVDSVIVWLQKQVKEVKTSCRGRA